MPQCLKHDVDGVVDIIHLTFMMPMQKLLPRIWVVESGWSVKLQTSPLLDPPSTRNTRIKEGLAQ